MENNGDENRDPGKKLNADNSVVNDSHAKDQHNDGDPNAVEENEGPVADKHQPTEDDTDHTGRDDNIKERNVGEVKPRDKQHII